jgi:hypothetical protein
MGRSNAGQGWAMVESGRAPAARAALHHDDVVVNRHSVIEVSKMGKMQEAVPTPTFICNFADGEQTRMTVHCPKGLDIVRGVKLARYAYESRTGKTPPAMLGATFVSSDDGQSLMAYGADELATYS